MKKAVLVLCILSLAFLPSCAVIAPAAPPTAKIAPPDTPSQPESTTPRIISPKPSLTPTTEFTKTPDIPTNPEFFESVGEIVSIEKNPADGQWYGIDTAQRAEIVYKDGEWVKFERPIMGADFPNFKYHYPSNIGITKEVQFDANSLEKLDLTEVPASEIVRLKTPEGAPLNWGYLEGSLTWPGNTQFQNRLPTEEEDECWASRYSGYFIGMVTADIIAYETSNPDNIREQIEAVPLFVFEIPNKYDRQIIMIYANSNSGARYYVSFGDTYSGDLIDVNLPAQIMSEEKMVDFLSSNIDNLKGQQCVIDLNFINRLRDDWNTLSQNKGYNYSHVWTMSQLEFFNSSFGQ